MAAPLDLTGLRFGTLTVLRHDGRVFWGRDQAAWLCRCDCSAELRVPQRRLTSKVPGHQQHGCDACRAKPCEVCGAPVSASSASKTCSPACDAERQRRYQLAYWHTNRRDDPNTKAARSERSRAEWAALDAEARREQYQRRVASEGRERINERARARHAEKMKDPAFAERHRAKNAAWQAAHPDETRRASRDHRRRQRAGRYARELGETVEAFGPVKENEDGNGDR